MLRPSPLSAGSTTVHLAVIVDDELLHSLRQPVATPVVNDPVTRRVHSERIEREEIPDTYNRVIFLFILCCKPCMSRVGDQISPGYLTCRKERKLFAFPPSLWNAIVAQARRCVFLLY